MVEYETQLKKIVRDDAYIISILKAVETLHLENAWVCAGLIRNKVWDILHNTTTPLNDLDVIYFNTSNTSLEKDKQMEKELEILLPNQPWSVKNQARMHTVSGFTPFTSTYDGVAHFPETPTAVAVRTYNEDIEIMAPYGLNDLFELNVRPTPFYKKGSALHSVYVKRVQKKKWNEVWEKLFITF